VTQSPETNERSRAEIQAAIGEIFGDHADLAQRYADLLTTDGITRGVLGPRETNRIWERHLLNSAVLASLIPDGARVIDLGSGAGLPGIPLAIARPDLQIVLLEPMQRRVQFLHDCLRALGLERVQVHHRRAEDGITPQADYVVVRAVGALERLIRLSFGMLVENGVLLALKGTSATGEVEQVRRTMTIEAELLSLDLPGQSATVVRVVRPSRLAGEKSATGRVNRPAQRNRRSR
jgi:16S rRNA (guanine527-N7)-methyltransferase